MKTIIFGGSFDPIHNGHIEIAKKSKEIINADRVVFIPARSPRWKSPRTNALDRINMLSLAIKEYDYMEINDIEISSTDEINYTYNTITKLKRNEDEEFYFLIGADQVERLHEWYRIEELSKLVHFIAFDRPNYSLNLDNVNKYHVEVIGSYISSMSSSLLRECRCLDAPKCILDYISDKRLYYMERLENYMNEKRIIHSISVASLCYEIALNNGVNPYKAYQAGILHDIGKYVDIDKQMEIIKQNYDEKYIHIQKALYHQFTSHYLCINDFKIEDEELLESILYHSTGSSNLSKLGKILYASDKIEPTRGFDSKELIKSCIENIDKGFELVLEENIKYFIRKGIDYHNPLMDSCINHYLPRRK